MPTVDLSTARWRKSSYSTNTSNCVEVAFPVVAWRKSTYSSPTANCVEVGFTNLAWQKSSHSGKASDCVEVAFPTPAVAVRDTKARAAGALVLPAAAWNHFLTTLP